MQRNDKFARSGRHRTRVVGFHTGDWDFRAHRNVGIPAGLSFSKDPSTHPSGTGVFSNAPSNRNLGGYGSAYAEAQTAQEASQAEGSS